MRSNILRSTLLLLVCFVSFSGYAQKQHPSFVHNNQILSYTITRYTPAWEIQPGTIGNQDIEQGSMLFRQVQVSQSGSLRSMIYTPGNIPALVQKMTDHEVLDYWKKTRVRMYYRIRYKGYNVFIARINSQASSSILPFRDQGGKWILDMDFINDPLFECLQRSDFDPFTGKFLGRSLVNLSFDELENGTFADYSGNDTKVELDGSNLATGRIGHCLKVDTRTKLTIPLKSAFTGGEFHFDCHLNLGNGGFATTESGVFSAQNGKSKMLNLKVINKEGEDSKLVLSVKGSSKKLEFSTLANTWFHLNITQRKGVVSVSVDGRKVGSVSTSSFKNNSLGDINVGGNGSAKFKLDELNIGL